jgi:hypothetical protein
MPNKKRNNFKIFLVLLTVLFILIPLELGNISFISNVSLEESYPKMSDFFKEDYSPILTKEKHGLGNVTINDINVRELELGFYIYNNTYPLLWEDYESGALNITLKDIKFIEMVNPAIKDNIDEKIQDSNIITIKINESLEINYNYSQEGYLIYHARFYPSRLLELFIDDGTNPIELKEETDYSIDKRDFIVFNYDSYFQKGPTYNFSMYLIWEHNISLVNWRITQKSGNNLIMSEVEQNFTAEYNYFFGLIGEKYGETLRILDLERSEIECAMTVNLPDKNLLHNHSLELRFEPVNINDHLNINKTIDVFLTNHFTSNNSRFSLNFTTSFTLKFIEPTGEFWAVDRLVENRNIRERIYIASIINGPQHIYLKYISFYEPTIYIYQVLDPGGNYSLFERQFAFFEVNTTVTGKEGIKITIPYLILGEICPFIIKYETAHNLKVVITDNIKMPLVGASVEIYYSGQKYGTYISNDRIQPIPPGTTNEHGEILLNDVPYGNYTIRVYYNGVFLKESTVSTNNNINYVYTNHPHFPLWIFVFGAINSIILIIGMIYYLKYKKMR